MSSVDPYAEFDNDPYAEFDTPAPKPSAAPKKAVTKAVTPKPGAPRELGWGEAISGGYGNMRKGAEQFGKAVRGAYADPVNAAYKAATGTMDTAEALRNLDADKAWAAIQAVGGEYAKRYGSLAGFKQAIHDHPYQVINDMVTVATLPIGGGIAAAGKTAAKVGARVAPGATAAAVTAVKGAGKMAGALGNALATSRPATVAARASATVPGWIARKTAKTIVAPTVVANDAAKFVTGKAVPWVASHAADVHNPKAVFMERVGEGKLPEIRTALSNSLATHPTSGRTVGEIVPGVNPTVSQAAAGVDASRFHGAVATARGMMPTETGIVDRAQDAGRAAHLRTVGGTPEQKAAREAMSDEFMKVDYPNADKIVSQGNQNFNNIMAAPNMEGVMEAAKNRALNDGRPFQIGENKPEWFIPEREIPEFVSPEYRHPEWSFDVPNANVFPGRAPQQKMPEIVVPPEVVVPAQTMPMQYVPPEFAQYPGRSLHDIKKIIDGKIAAAPPGSDEARQLSNQWNKVLTWMSQEGGNPEYNIARQTRARGMKAVNQMEYGQLLEKRLSDSPAAYLSARDNPLTETLSNNGVRNITTRGEPRYRKEADLMTPEQLDVFNNVSDDILRAQRAALQAGEGGDPGVSRMLADVLHVRPENVLARPFIAGKNKKYAEDFAKTAQSREKMISAIDEVIARRADIDAVRRKYNWGINTDTLNPLRSPNTYNPWRIMNNSPALYNPLIMSQQQDQPRNALAR